MSKQDSTKKAYEFLRECATSGEVFTIDELAQASGWSQTSVKTYLSKKLGQLVERLDNGELRAKREILKLPVEGFLGHMTQVKPVFTSYTRQKYEHILTYEFLLPLTREDKLRRSLDALFFTDTIKTRLQEIGLDALDSVIHRSSTMDDDAYISSVIQQAQKIASGYSISHASGRFRASALLTRAEAGNVIAQDGRYLVDETVAVVRFIIPLDAGVAKYGSSFDDIFTAVVQTEPTDQDALQAELTANRVLFFQLFVEAIVRTVDGEDEIWLIETAPAGRRLFTWSRSS